LAQILDRLSKVDIFQTFIDGWQSYTLRLIPVSSVGKNFVKEENGKTVKIPGAYVAPFQVEMPLACILPDIFDAQIKRLGVNTRWRRNLAFLSNAAGGNGLSWLMAPIVLLSWLTISVNLGIFGVSFELFKDNLHERYVGPQDVGLVIKGKKAALEHASKSFRRLVYELEQRFPESNITKFRRGSHP